MIDPLAGIRATKNQLEYVRSQMENEHYNLAQLVQIELTEKGYPCEIVEQGTQRFGGVKVKKWIIVSKNKDIDQQEFQNIKDQITKELAQQRQAEIKEEGKELKIKNKLEKKNARK